MLILDRYEGDVINTVNIGDNIAVKILCVRKINGKLKVRLGIIAPENIPVWRNEIYQKIKDKIAIEEGEQKCLG